MDDEYFKNMKYDLDNLTGLYRRNVIFSYLDYLITKKTPFSFFILDIDNFKTYNDTYGHLVGDIVLKTVSNSLNELVKDKGIIGRYGGDEFIFVYPNITEYDDVWKIAFDLLKSTNTLRVEGYDDIRITYSLGISRYPLDSTTLDDIITTADKALYRGKIKGRNCFIIYLAEKHSDIKLQAMRDKFFTPALLEEKIYKILTRNSKIDLNIKEAIDFLGAYLLIDHLCLELDNKLLFEYHHPLAPKMEFKPYGFELINENMPTNGLFIDNTTKQNKTNELSKYLANQNIYSTILCEMKAFKTFYGYLRADITIVDTGRIWQADDLAILTSFANYISLILYSKKKKL